MLRLAIEGIPISCLIESTTSCTSSALIIIILYEIFLCQLLCVGHEIRVGVPLPIG